MDAYFGCDAHGATNPSAVAQALPGRDACHLTPERRRWRSVKEQPRRRAPSRAALRFRCEGSRLKLASASRLTNRGLLGSRRILTGPTGLAVWVREHGLTDSAAPGSRSDSARSQQDADALCLASDATEHLNVRQLLALQFAKKGEALCADPRNRRKFGSMRPLQILDSEEARVGQSSGTSERQSSALPGLGRQPVLFKGRRFASHPAVCQLCPQPLTSSRFTFQFGLPNTSMG